MRTAASLVALLWMGCPKPESSGSSPPPHLPEQRYDQVDRAGFNRVALEVGAPLFWADDEESPGVLDPHELAVTWGPWGASRQDFVVEQRFTPAFDVTYAAIVGRAVDGWDDEGLDEAEARRRAAVRRELAQGRPTLLRLDLSDASEVDRELAAALVVAADAIEVLYDLQLGSRGLAADIPFDDGASRMLAWRNHGPWCAAPATETDPDCRALADTPPQRFGLYPADVQEDPGFCEVLEAEDGLMAPFTAVRRSDDGGLVALPYPSAWPEEMAAARGALLDAAAVVEDVESEAALHAYLLAAAQAFQDNSWFEADRAWAAMNAHNSAWYLRVGPDETYFEPCNRKAGFHLTLARINPGSLAWHERLSPLKQQMEDAMAELAGPPYEAREVAFHLPDFIDVALNAGDDRSNLGATVGQSLPNWGPVSEEGGRTVAMTNLDGDPDGRVAKLAQARSVMCADAMDPWVADGNPLLMTTLLHEAAHNLGPAQEYRVDGQTDEEVFGGPLATMFEELKAQTAALFFTDWLVTAGVITTEEAEAAHLADIIWSLGKVSQGMYTPEGRTRSYSQLAAIQLGSMLDAGVLTWRGEELAANGEDVGCMAVDYAAVPAAVDDLARDVVSIKARIDAPDAEELRDRYVHDETWLDQWALIRERWLRSQTASYAYAIEW